jgi:hypothetical protein
MCGTLKHKTENVLCRARVLRCVLAARESGRESFFWPCSLASRPIETSDNCFHHCFM